MAHDDFVAGGRMWLNVLRKQHPDDFRALMGELADQ
jgi:hypothetical protein